MAAIPSPIGYHLLRLISAVRGDAERVETAYLETGKVRMLLGPELLQLIQGKRAVDFGCGEGCQALELLSAGARHVQGVDIRPEVLEVARENARRANETNRAEFGAEIVPPVDVIVSLDAFEHFSDPGGVLDSMYEHLEPGGVVITAFGPTWYHPLGGHLFSVFPWSHIILAERCLLRWRSDRRDDGATRFSEVAGGLNQMTIGRFERLIEASGFKVLQFEAVPIRRLRRVAARWNREFTTAMVRAVLQKPDLSQQTAGVGHLVA